MEYFLQMLEIQGSLFLYILLGIFLRKKNVLSEPVIKGMINYTLIVAMPAMIFNSFAVEVTADTGRHMAYIITISTALAFGALLLGKLLFRRVPDDERRVMMYGMFMSNAGFAGMPLVSMVFGEQAVFYASMYLLPLRAIVWTIGIALFAHISKKDALKNFLFHPASIATWLGFLRLGLGVSPPRFADIVLQNVGNSTTSLSIILVGCMLAEIDFSRAITRNVLVLSTLRLAVLPLITLFVLRLLPLDPLVVAVCVILAGMPVGINTALFAKQFSGNYQFASKCIFVSTMLSLLTIPLLTLLF